MTPTQSLGLASAALAILTFIVAIRLLMVRIREMRNKRLSPQKIATSTQLTAQLQFAETVQAADNFRNLFELPVLFYALCGLVIALDLSSDFFATGAWLFVALRYLHSFIHCTYNEVMHRFAVFILGFLVLAVLWLSLIFELLQKTT